MRRVNLYDIGSDQDNLFIHLARYMFVLRQLKITDRVLEIGCGTGYGSRLLADKCAKVVATDQACELKELWDRYKKENLTFSLDIPDELYDVVVSFEVIEHIPEAELSNYFQKIKSRLTREGVVYMSTPRALPFEERSRNRQLEHVKEYSPKEFRDLLEKYFRRVFLFSQNDGIISTQNPDMAWNLVAICLD
jgi:cyclopropane fatty-acyl-phospholipid synthase-like methyltransferase